MNPELSHLKILQSGPGTSIQDRGRSGYAQYGIPLSGVQDQHAMDWINHFLQNHPDDAVLEINQPGFKAEFSSPTLLCLAGALASVSLNRKEINPSGLVQVSAGDRLEIGKFIVGSVVFLGVKGGFQTSKVMGSRSWFRGITAMHAAQKGDLIPYVGFSGYRHTLSRMAWHITPSDILAVHRGPDWDLLEPSTQRQILDSNFKLSHQKDRMAIQLQEKVANQLQDILTAPVFPGTVQLTSGGKLLILMRDAQTTGGYPRILQLADDSLASIAQLRPGQAIQFAMQP